MKKRASLCLLFFTSAVARVALATGGYYEDAPPTLPWFLDRLPAKTPAQIFAETTTRAVAKPIDFRAALRALAADAESARKPAPALLATAEELLTQARLAPVNPAPLCNLLGDVRDLLVATPPVDGKRAAAYIRWRVDHAQSFRVSWQEKPSAPPASLSDEEIKKRAAQLDSELRGKILDKSAGPLRAHWSYLKGALEFPEGGAKEFQEVVSEFPQHPRAEVARFMLARCKFAESRSHAEGEKEAAAADRAQARGLFEDYLKRYPNGRFIADTPGWLGAIAFDEGDYLGALGFYLKQADTPGHPEVLKSAGQMCERCLSRLSASNADEKALGEIAARPTLAMSLIYLVVNTSESDNNNGELETPEEVNRWRRALLPRLATAVAAHEAAYKTAEWQPRYLAILAQAASGSGDQKKALALCNLAAPGDLDRDDDLAFIRLAALQRDGRLPEAIAAGRKFLERFPQSPLARGAALRTALALQDNHQAGLAIAELMRLQKLLTQPGPKTGGNDGEDFDATEHLQPAEDDPKTYPNTDGELGPARSVLRHDATGAEPDQIAQIIDALLNFAPLPELAAGVGNMEGADAAQLRAVLAQRWLAEEENFAEAKKYATPAQWGIAAAGLEKLAAAAGANPKNADALQRLADGWAAARGKLVFAPLETDETRKKLFGADGADLAGLSRRENGCALGLKAERVDRALESRDELRHAQAWWLRAADAAPAGSAARAHALWLALRALPPLAYASPFTWARAGETDASASSRKLYERLRRECPDSREAREFAVYYDLPGPAEDKNKSHKSAAGGKATEEEEKDAEAQDAVAQNRVPDPSQGNQNFPQGEPDYRFEAEEAFGVPSDPDGDYTESGKLESLVKRVLALRTSADASRLRTEVTALRGELKKAYRSRNATFLLNFVDDLSDFLQEDAAKLTPAAVRRYVGLRIECLNVEAWGGWNLPPVPGTPPGDAFESDRRPLGQSKGLDDTVLTHIRAAYKAPELAPFADFLDFLAMAIIANHPIEVTVPGVEKDGQPYGYTSRDYPKLAKLTGQFLAEHPRSRKREAALLLHARALYATSRPTLIQKFAVWPESGHFASRQIVSTYRREPFKPRELGAALNAYDKEFPGGRYAGEIRNLRALLAWRTQEWALALDLTLQALDDPSAPDLQSEAATRLANIFSDGLTDDTERAGLMAAIKTRPGAAGKLRAYLEKCDYPLRALGSWAKAQL